MTVLISQYTVYLFGVVIVALSVWGVVVPNRLIALVTGSMNRGWGLYFGIGSRVVLGVALRPSRDRCSAGRGSARSLAGWNACPLHSFVCGWCSAWFLAPSSCTASSQ